MAPVQVEKQLLTVPGLADTTSSSHDQDLRVPRIIDGPDGDKQVRVLLAIPALISARQIAVRPVEDRLLIFRVGGANGELSMLHQELLDTIQLPESVDPFTVEASINRDGLLEVKAPLTQ